MKARLFGFLLLLCTLGLLNVATVEVASAQQSSGAKATWYIRADGGTRYSAKRASNGWTAQCDGQHDAPFPASGAVNMLGQKSNGVNQPCAFNDYRYLYDDQTYGNSAWVISGGDTVIIRGGPWRIGFDQGASANDVWCAGGNGPYACTNPTIPAGTAAQHTRILGENYASCGSNSKMTQLFGGFGVYTPMNLNGAQFVDVQCMELTRHSQCMVHGSPVYPSGCSSYFPIDDFDQDGVLTDVNTHDILMQDMWIHGHTDRGVKGPIGGIVTANRVTIAYNGMAGWDFDDGNSTPSVNAVWNFTNSTIEWSGCNQEYPITHTYPAISCYSQSSGGYGDGVGTPAGMGLDVHIDHSTFRYNTQDGEDLGHVDTGNHTLTITNSLSYANNGGQFKWGPNMTTVVFENNLAVANCLRMSQPLAGAPSTYNANLGDFCRSFDALSFNFRNGGTALFANNTIVSYSPTTFDIACWDTSCANSSFTLRNNIVRGYDNPKTYNMGGQPGGPGGYYYQQTIPTTRSNNIYYGIRGSCPNTGINESCPDPLFVGEPAAYKDETTLDSFNFLLSSASPARGAGVPVAGLTTDYNGFPFVKPPSVGGLEYASAPTGAPATPTLASLSFTPASPIALVVGSSMTPACTATYSDASSTSCTSAGATFSSDATASATANSAGMLTAVAAGTGHLLAAVGSIVGSDSFTVTAPQPVKNVSISVAQPQFGFNVIPGATRRIFATVSNGTTSQVTWSVKSGSAQISATSGSWIDVAAGATGSSCQLASSGSVVSSSAQFTIEATSVDDTSRKADITFNVCSPTVQISTIPSYRTLYANQVADIQSLVLGSVNDAVQWAITSQPTSGDGKLADANSRDAVFSATVSGRYTLTATSLASKGTTATTILYVTGRNMPYRVTRNLTEPVDCSVDPALTGTIYEVGPTQTYHNLKDVPLSTLKPGSTIRVHNEDTSGSKPTTYYEYIQLSQQATAAQPIRVCGMPDTGGNLPVLDATNAVGRSDISAAATGNGLVTVGGSTSGSAWPAYSGAQNIIIEGLHLRNARPGVAYTTPSGTAATWQSSAACIRVGDGHNISLVGNEFDGCSNGAASSWNGTTWGGSSLSHLWEGNYVHGSGASGSSANHQMYLQAWGQVVQFNRIDQITTGATGANLKSRGVQDVIRYNYFGDGSARDLDLVDVQSAAQFMSFADFLQSNTSATNSTYSMDQLAAWQEAWNSHFAYGNIYLNSTSLAPIHFGYDVSAGEAARKGNLYWYNNSFYGAACPNCTGSLWTMFDTSGGGGLNLAQTEFPTVQIFNNLSWLDSVISPAYQWNNFDAFIGIGSNNLLPSGWGTNTLQGGAGDGWNAAANSAAYQNASSLSLHVSGFNGSNVATASTTPFDKLSWTLASALTATATQPSAICRMPTRFTYLPTLGYAVPRTSSTNLGATDTVAQTSAIMNIMGSTRRANLSFSACH